MKIKNKTYVFLVGLTLLAVWFFSGRYGLFASLGDWSSQHSVIPDYFRRQFYETGKLFPEFAAGIGGGQNIYNLSYYGLYSPLILPSYLLPFLNMSDYLMVISVVCLTASVLLMYAWLSSHGFAKEICFIVTVLFLLAAPMIYQFHRQVMFVDYMPFLCMALLGVDRYWEKGKTGLYTAGVFGMIMTSFYFSIAGIFALLLYGVSRYRRMEWKRPLFRFLLPVAAAAASSGILLVPTAYALFARSTSAKHTSLAQMFLPDFSVTRFAYSGYGIGLTMSILMVLFLGIFCKEKRERFLSAGCLAVMIIPFFSWLFNGALYAREKSLIPFLPILCYLTASCLERMQKKQEPLKRCTAGYLLMLFWCVTAFAMFGQGSLKKWYALIFIEPVLLLFFFVLYRKTRIAAVLLVPSVLCLIVCGIYLNSTKTAQIDQDFYARITDDAWEEKISDVLSQETGLFRLEQKGDHEEQLANINRIWNTKQWTTSIYSSAYQDIYRNFRENVFQTEQPFRNCLMQPSSGNPLFQKFMGVKYLAGASEENHIGADDRLVKGEEKVTVETNGHAAPVIYATNQVISREDYQKLSFPYNQTVLMRYAVAGAKQEGAGGQMQVSSGGVKESDVWFPENAGIHKTEDGYHIKSSKEIRTKVFAAESREDLQTAEGKLLYLQFDVGNHQDHKDVIVEIAGIRNNLSAKSHIYYNGNTTFTYVIKLEKNQREAAVVFGKGDYSISNIKSFLGDASILKEDALYQSDFCPNWSLTKGNQICGNIQAVHDGYLITSIPYDKGFEVYIDGRRRECEIVNTAFLGAAISKGRHRIEIVYHAPGVWFGKLMSGMGALLWIGMAVMERKKKYVYSVSFGYNFLTFLLYNRKKTDRSIYGKHIDYRRRGTH